MRAARLGQGANQAIQDAACLADKPAAVALATSPTPPPRSRRQRKGAWLKAEAAVASMAKDP